MHCRVFSSILGLYPLDASTPPPWDSQKCPDIVKCLQRGKVLPSTIRDKLLLGE